MEAFALYLIRSVAWLTGFALIFILFLRNERFFFLNRIYLIAGILTSFFFPFISIHYTVVIPVVKSMQAESAVVSDIQNAGTGIFSYLRLFLFVLYISGFLFVLTQIIRQGRRVLLAIKKSEVITLQPVKLIRTPEYATAFSFFSYVFVNPSITDIETAEIMNHEMVHIRQKHWLDLVLVELLCIMQWFNPLAWIYVRFMRQNHEYLADEVALQRTSDPAIYRAALLNQIVGAPVVSLANSFNYSLNKKRFNMMKNIISSPYRKMKILLILPVFAIVLYAFAKPDYKFKSPEESLTNNDQEAAFQTKGVKGTVIQQDGTALPGAIITLKGTTKGTLTDADGSFTFGDVPGDGLLVVSFVGYKSKVLKPVFTSDMIISMIRDTVKYMNLDISTPPPPPPPPPVMNGKPERNSGDATPPPPPPLDFKSLFDGPQPLIMIDGVISSKDDADRIDPNSIESISVLKDKDAVGKYGEKGKNGAVEINSRKAGADNSGSFTPSPPPPPVPSDKTGIDGPPPLYVVDGIIITKEAADKINPDNIASVNVLKNKSATIKPAVDKYGEKGKNGVVEIITKDYQEKLFTVIDGVEHEKGGMSSVSMEDVKSMNVLTPGLAVSKYGEKAKNGAIEVTTFKKGEKRPETKKDPENGVLYNMPVKEEAPVVVVEELPQFPGGKDAMTSWIVSNIKYPAEAVKSKITGKVLVNFMVTTKGKIENVVVIKSVSPVLDAEAKRVISSMPDWKPGAQAGKNVPVQIQVPVEFKLN